MNDVETNLDAGMTKAKTTRKPRKRNDERRIFVYRMDDGKPRELGSFPETSIGSPAERRLPAFLHELFGDGEYKAEIRKPNGHFERSIDFSIAEDEKPQRMEFEPEIEADFDNEPEEIEVEIDPNTNALQLQLMIEREKNKRLSSEVQTIKAGSQNEMQITVAALEKAYEKNTELSEKNMELMMLTLSNAQKPQQDPTTLMLSMLKGTLEVQRGVRELSAEIAPNASNGESNSIFGDAARLVDSLGKSLPAFLPLIMGNRTIPTARAQKPPPQTPALANASGNGEGELSSLLAKVKMKGDK
jgi:hypothetical protein